MFRAKALGYSVFDGCDAHYWEIDGSVYSAIFCSFWPAVDFGFYGLVLPLDNVSYSFVIARNNSLTAIAALIVTSSCLSHL